MLKLVSSIFFILFTISFGSNNYVIDNYKININITEKNVYKIEEEIQANFLRPSRGLYRKIPTKYNGRTIKVTDIKVNEKSLIKESDDTTFIRLGDPNKYITGIKDYKIYFNHNLGWDKTNEYDEVYYNLIGNDWNTTIKKVEFSVTLPKPFDINKISFTSGSRGNTTSNGVYWQVKGNTIYGYTTSSLSPYDSLTLAIPLENGYFDIGSSKIFYYLNNIIYSVGKFLLFGIYPIILFIAFYIYKKNKKELKVIETVEFYPPDNLTPTEVGYYIDGSVDAKDLTSMIFYWGDKGYLSIIEKETGRLFNRKQIFLEKLKDIETDKTFERYLFDSLFAFANGNIVNISELRNEFYIYMEKTSDIFQIDLIKNKKTLYSKENKTNTRKITFLIPVTMLSTFILISTFSDGNFPNVILFFIATIITSALLEKLSRKLRVRSEYGNKILGRCRGFKKFLEVTEKDKLEMLLEENPNYFYDILPYAIVLGVSDIWANKFKDLVTAPPTWYNTNSTNDVFVFSHFMGRFNNSLNSLNNSMLSSPKSSTNFGGGRSSSSGGSSGGGAGGGGGGSW
ncbi:MULTISPECIES: DUF2207 domain-containing protein [Fusobacterium]|uniref:DUF2207 domain-containing protein n=1 Tax=Fusobacterium TaxID=848 RepID=UPI001476E66A|nr:MULTISPECIES: DUF2207 domain-containing protein [Fusobacterium]NME35216.1 DUF2207 domain-containing protein [Fusobacterium sp. FSA-380-WT-3A]